MIKYCIISILLFVTLISATQNTRDLELIRAAFQDIEKEEDVKSIIDFKIIDTIKANINVLKAYKGAAQCMMAAYVFSPVAKLRNFNEGKKILEGSIMDNRNVENIYLRLLIQLNVPKILEYHKSIDEDILFLNEHLPKEPIDMAYKNLMIQNLVSVAKNKEQKNALLQIKLSESS